MDLPWPNPPQISKDRIPKMRLILEGFYSPRGQRGRIRFLWATDGADREDLRKVCRDPCVFRSGNLHP